MQNCSDAHLLLSYAENGSEQAFHEIAKRYADLVYSCALRQLHLSDLATDITQIVFMDLARKAKPLSRKLQENGSLLGWLHRSTCYAVLKLRRDEGRRRQRERQFMKESEQLEQPAGSRSAEWEEVRHILDQALCSLGEQYREALLLRFFQKQDFRAIAAALGISEDAAQKRVSRGLGKLRQYLLRSGIGATTGSLSILMSTNAVESAPAWLVSLVSSPAALAGTAKFTSSAIAVTKVTAMSTLHKTLIIGTLAATLGAGVYQFNQKQGLRREAESLRQQQAGLLQEVQSLQEQRDEGDRQIAALKQDLSQSATQSKELLRLRGEVERLRRDSQELVHLKESSSAKANDPAFVLAQTWADRVTRLRQRLEQHPEESIPELQFATDVHWLNSVGFPIQDEKDMTRALSLLRQQAVSAFSSSIKTALSDFLDANPGQFPTDLTQLLPYCDSTTGNILIKSYEIVPTTEAKGTHLDGDWMIRRKMWPNPDSNARLAIFAGGASWYNVAP